VGVFAGMATDQRFLRGASGKDGANSRVEDVCDSLGRLSAQEQAAVMKRFLMSAALGGTTGRETLADVLVAIARRIAAGGETE
jgi:hypothetical protein